MKVKLAEGGKLKVWSLGVHAGVPRLLFGSRVLAGDEHIDDACHATGDCRQAV